MKKVYVNPEITIELIELKEVILESQPLVEGGFGGFGEEEYPW